jgi:hypothetical protein
LRKLHSVELHDLYASNVNINAYNVLDGNLKERDHLEDSEIDGRMILKCILKKYIK